MIPLTFTHVKYFCIYRKLTCRFPAPTSLAKQMTGSVNPCLIQHSLNKWNESVEIILFPKYDRVQTCGWLPPFARCKSPKTASEGQPVQAWTRTTGVATCECSTQATLLGWISVVPLAHRWSSQTHKVSIIIIYTYYRNQHCRSGGCETSVSSIFYHPFPFFFSSPSSFTSSFTFFLLFFRIPLFLLFRRYFSPIVVGGGAGSVCPHWLR